MRVPLYQGVMERIMLGGLPRNVAIMGGTMGAAITLGFQTLWVLPPLIAGYIVLVLLYKQDDYFLEILLQHIKDDDHLYP